MAPRLEFLFNSQLFSVVMASENEFSNPNMALSLWVSLSTLFLTVLGFLHRFVSRAFKGGKSLKNTSSLSEEDINLINPSSPSQAGVLPEQHVVDDSSSFSLAGAPSKERDIDDSSSFSQAGAPVEEYVVDDSLSFSLAGAPVEDCGCGNKISGSSNSDENTKQDFVFKFRFQTYEEFSKNNTEEFSSVGLNSNAGSSLSNRYEFLTEKSTSHFMEEESFTVKVMNSYSSEDFVKNILEKGNFSIEELREKVSESEPVEDKIPESSANDSENRAGEILAQDSDSPKRKSENIQTNPRSKEEFRDENEFLTENDFVDLNFDTESTNSSFECSIMSQSNSSTIGFLSESDFEDGTPEEIDRKGENPQELDLDMEELYSVDLNFGYEPEDFENDDDEINEELRKIEELETQNSEKLPENPVDSGKSKAEDSSVWESEESNGLETQWEHQELVEQLKMELRKVRATGLPTIFEESESPKIMADLKPWKIEERYQHGDRMDELHKFYKSYRERMRKLDILNYQKMYAIGFLQSKDPLKSISSSSKPSSSSPSITSLLSHNLRLYRHKKSQVDPMKNFIREMHCDLEMVYVGQMCLSWEFIHWQYGKALDLWDSEPYGLHHYNEVAGEFQQFQVLLQRFVENEAFDGPRVENYVKHRCVSRNLLQVPVIREDKQRDKRKGRRDKNDEEITSDVLIEILQESIRVIWQFIRADKDHNTAALKRPRNFQVQLQDPADIQLLMDIQADLQKKERKLKDKVRSGHCILKKMQNEEDDAESDVHFFCQVDMKLVSRVLKMSRITTDQLLWCRNKLSRINFINKKLHVEPSFFLFPS